MSVGFVGADQKFRLLTAEELRAYLAEINVRFNNTTTILGFNGNCMICLMSLVMFNCNKYHKVT